MSNALDKKHQAALRPYGELFASLVKIHDLTDEQLSALDLACCAASPTNCWWADYRAAMILRTEVADELERREILKKDEEKKKNEPINGDIQV